MKKTLAQIGAVVESAVSSGKPDDFLARVNQTITNFKSMMELAAKVQGGNLGGNIAAAKIDPTLNRPADQKNSGGSFSQFLQTFLASEYGDLPIGQLLEQLSPYTVKQIMETAKSARPKK